MSCKFFAFLISSSLLLSCAPVRFVKPLAKKEQAFDVSLGGPLFEYNSTTIPMPFLSLSYGYGIDSTLTGFGAVNVTSALYGNFQAELGITKQLIHQQHYIPAVSIIPVFNIMYRNRNASRLYPQLDICTFWEYGEKNNLIYIVASNWFELSSKRTLEQEQQHHWFFSPAAGHTFTGKKWNVNLEAKVIAPFISNDKLVIEYKTPFNNNGALGIYLGVTRKF